MALPTPGNSPAGPGAGQPGSLPPARRAQVALPTEAQVRHVAGNLLAEGLAAAGCNTIGLGNNHTFDRGQEGVDIRLGTAVTILSRQSRM